METIELIEAQEQEYYKIEEVFEDKYCEIFDTVFSFRYVDLLNNKLKVLRNQGTNIHGVFCSHFHFFTIEQTLNFSEFVDW